VRRAESEDLPRETTTDESTIDETVVLPSERPPLVFERAAVRVKADSSEVRKYFSLEDDASLDSLKGAGILVLGEVREGDEEFGVRYDLNEAPDDLGQMRIGFSLHDGNAEVLLRDEFVWNIPGESEDGVENPAGLLLAFDDDFRDAWEDAFDLFDRYRARVTFFVQGEYSPFCKEALERGHDIGYHTAHHLNLLNLSHEEFYRETLVGVEDFRREGIPLRSFAYPYGFSNPWMRETLRDSFPIQRGFGVTFRVYGRDSLKSGDSPEGAYIISRSVDNILFEREEDFEAMIDAMLRTVKFTGGILPLTTHDISDAADWGISAGRLEYLLKTARDLRLRFYRYSDFARE
jgi:peptidoglycan/xylan/chitin deacetylase (PgdA/CDA1 family)